MKAKFITFMILLPICEVLALVGVFLSQAMYDIKVHHYQQPFTDIFIHYLLHPISAVTWCIEDKNPMVFILPLAVLVLLMYGITRKHKTAAQIDETSGIYGNANWERPENLTRKNFRKQSKFTICSKRSFMNNFLESIDEK